MSKAVAAGMTLAEGLAHIQRLDGITAAAPIPAKARAALARFEDPKNEGVARVFSKRFVAVALHDGTFRPPLSDIILHQIGSPLFPPTEFPEIPAGVAASPGMRLHRELIRRYALPAGPRDATLLIGWD